MSNDIINILKMKELELPNIKTESEFKDFFDVSGFDCLNSIIFEKNNSRQGDFIFKNIENDYDSNYDEEKETESINITIKGQLEYKDMFFDFSYYLESDTPRLEYAELVEDGAEFKINIEKTIKNIENVKKMKELNIPNIRTEEELSDLLGINNLNLLERLNTEHERTLPNGLEIKDSKVEQVMFEVPYEDSLHYNDHSIIIKSNELEFEFKYRKTGQGYIDSHSFNMLKEESINNKEESNKKSELKSKQKKTFKR